MAKFVWQDGTLVSKAKVKIGGTIYEVDPEEYSGSTPLSASNLNAMVDQTYQDLKDYVDEKQTYSTKEIVVGTWIDGKPIYRKVINSTCPSQGNKWVTISSNLNADEIISYTGYVEFSTSEHKLLANGTSQFTYFQLKKTSNELQMATTDNGFFGKPIRVIIEYTKTTN